MKKIELEEVVPSEIYGMINKKEEPKNIDSVSLGYNGNDCEDKMDLFSKELPKKIAKKIEVIERENSNPIENIFDTIEGEFEESNISLIPKQQASKKKKFRIRKRIKR